jgi:TRAP-type C4-dicarboxylate transport system substrate-binding protein
MDTPELTPEQRRELTRRAREARKRQGLERRTAAARELLESLGYTIIEPETREPETRDASGSD